MLPLNRGGDKCQVLAHGPDPLQNQLRAHSQISIIPKIIKYVECKVSTWQNIADLNMIKRSS